HRETDDRRPHGRQRDALSGAARARRRRDGDALPRLRPHPRHLRGQVRQQRQLRRISLHPDEESLWWQPDLLSSICRGTSMWAYLAVLSVSVLIQYALQPKPPQPPSAELKAIDAPTADEGRPVPVVFGTVLVKSANVVWYGDLRTTPIKSKGGKK